MPNPYGSRDARIQPHRAGLRDVHHQSRDVVGPSRRDPQGDPSGGVGNEDERPQGASAMGNPEASNRRSRENGGDGKPALLVTSVAHECASLHPEERSFEIGVSVAARETQNERVSDAPSSPRTWGGEEPSDRIAHRRGRVPRRCPIEERPPHGGSRGNWMNPMIASLDTVSLEEALTYLDTAEGDELAAAYALAKDRNQLDGSDEEPDDAEVHHALFLLRRARGLNAPSFDLMRIQLKRRVAA